MSFTKYRSFYPVIHGTPSIEMCLKHARSSDWTTAILMSASAIPAGYFCRGHLKPIKMIALMLPFSTILGVYSAVLAAGGRLTGMTENRLEVTKNPYRLDYTRWQVRTEPFRVITEEERHEIEDYPRF